MAKLVSIFFIIQFFLLGLGQAFEVPNLTGPIVDQVGLLGSAEQAKISDYIRQSHDRGGPQLQVLILKTLDGLSIEQAAIQVFDQWKLGSAKEDNGVLLILAIQEKKVRIEVGRGLEGQLPDVIAKRIITENIRPYFKRGEYALGVFQGVTSILQYAGSDQAPPVIENQDEAKLGKFFIFLIVGFWIILFFFNPWLALSIFFSGRGGGGSGWGGSSGGDGSWSGGGGDSAGGGASGDW